MKAVKTLDLSKLRKEHENKWVALKHGSGEVVATAKTLVALAAKFTKGIPSNVVVHRVLPPEVYFAPSVV